MRHGPGGPGSDTTRLLCHPRAHRLVGVSLCPPVICLECDNVHRGVYYVLAVAVALNDHAYINFKCWLSVA